MSSNTNTIDYDFGMFLPRQNKKSEPSSDKNIDKNRQNQKSKNAKEQTKNSSKNAKKDKKKASSSNQNKKQTREKSAQNAKKQANTSVKQTISREKNKTFAYQNNEHVFQAPAKRVHEIKRPTQVLVERKPVLTILKVVIAIIIVLIASLVLSAIFLFNIDKISITGSNRYSNEQILGISKIENGANIFLVDTEGIENKIPNELYYVESVKVSRVLPREIKIDVKDCVVAGSILQGNRYLTISSNGKALEISDSVPSSYPKILGVDVIYNSLGKSVNFIDEDKKKVLKDLSEALFNNELYKITAIDLSDITNTKVVYDNRIKLEFGLPFDFDYKIRFAKDVLMSGKIQPTERGTLDLSLSLDLSRAYYEPDYTAPILEDEEASDETAATAEPGEDNQQINN